MKKVVLCGEGKCCPEAFIGENDVIIRDDNGNEITLSRKQAEILIDHLK